MAAITDRLEFENGVLVKIDGARPEYMNGNKLIRLVKELAAALPRIDHAEAALAELQFAYTNHRGESGRRRVVPIRVWFGSTNWHPTQQWFLRALDLDKDEERDFAFADVREVSNG
ncbi:hypothetical protein [Mesorhizobium sp.]|uniref:hypothetical protein n=1 Tax=Mesorhizobium sp. TaxID=1871066 RepID=UPI00257B2037|nr:hypothetical protein [Mesorhizobium sp.]